MKRRYTVTYAGRHGMVVEIDHDVAALHAINDFWSNNLTRLQRAGGDITRAVLTLLGLTAFGMTNAVYRLKYEGVEGWPKLDGSAGILLVSLDDFELDENEITIATETI